MIHSQEIMMLTPNEALKIITQNKQVAIVGLSPKEDRPSYRVGKFLLQNGYKVTPVNPGQKEVLGQTCVKSLEDLDPQTIDWIDLFVNPSRLMDFADAIVNLSPKLVWCQLGVVNERFNTAMENANIPLIVDACPKIELENRQQQTPL